MKILATKQSNWRGCPKIKMEYYNDTADPSLIYKGYRFNYWDIEDALWNDFLESTGYSDSDADNPEVEKEFDKYVCDFGPSYLDDCLAFDYFEKGSKDWRDRYNK